MESYIDWNDATNKAQNEVTNVNMNASGEGVSHTDWQNIANVSSIPMQNPYNVEYERKSEQRSFPSNDYARPAFQGAYVEKTISPSISPPVSNQQQYIYPQMMAPQQRQVSDQGYSDANSVNNHGITTTIQHQSYNTPSSNNQNHPQSYGGHQSMHNYSYASNSVPYNVYQSQGTQGYTNAYSQDIQAQKHGVQQAQNGPQHANYPVNPSQTHYHYQYAPPANNQYYPQQAIYPQYQRPEDALHRVQQTWSANKVGNDSMQSSMPSNHFQNWQHQQPAVTYYGMDSRPKATIKEPKSRKSSIPTEAPRPTDPLAALRYDVTQCLTEYNTSRDLKGCATALLAVMASCDPVLPSSELETSKSSSPDVNKSNGLDVKLKQITLLDVVSTNLRGLMIDEVANNKSIRAKLRTWFVRAHKDNAFEVLQALLKVLDKLTPLSARLLAEVKFGKALLIVSRKCEDKDVREQLAKWVSKAEESLGIERELDAAAAKAPASEEDSQKRKTTAINNTTDAKSLKKLPVSSIRKLDEKSKAASIKKTEPTAKTNAAFFKKEPQPLVKPVVAKPGMAAALAGIKVRKKVDGVKGLTDVNKAVIPTNSVEVNGSGAPKSVPSAKNSFSALKLVEGLKRSASPIVVQDAVEPESKKQKKRKHVSWRPDAELEQIQIFETIEPEGGWGIAHIPHEYGNARDLDRREGAILHGGLLPDRDEDFLDWETPRELNFSSRNLADDRMSRGPKKAGTGAVTSPASQAEETRESTVFLAVYASESEIPWSPSEALVTSRGALEEIKPPRTIPLPEELRGDWRIRQILGDLADACPPNFVKKAPYSSLPPSSAQANVETPVVAKAATPDITAILASIMASQQSSSANVAPNPAMMPPLPVVESLQLPIVDNKLVEFLKQAAATSTADSGSMPQQVQPPQPYTQSFPPMPQPPQGMFNQASEKKSGSSQPLPAQFGGLRDMRPWVKFNDGGRYREPCRYMALGKCEKGDQCGYLHLDVPGPHR